MRELTNGSENLGASFSVLHSNDHLLQRKILMCEQFDTLYSTPIAEYFTRINSIKDEDLFNRERIKTILDTIEKIWVFIHNKVETKLIFDDYSDFERNLFLLPSYRGHFIHQFNVFLLGYYILNKLLNVINKDDRKRIFDKTEFHENFVWMLTSTFHDMGYPIEKMEHLITKYFDMFLKVKTEFNINIEEIITNNFNDYIRYLSEYHYHIDALGENQWNLERGSKRDYLYQDTLYNKLRKISKMM